MRIKIKGDFSDSANDWIDELMLNDWFLSQDGIDDTCEDVYEWEASKYSSFDDLNYVTENNIVLPLELTNDMLVLNGFGKSEGTDWFWLEGFPFNLSRYIYRDPSVYEVSVDNGGIVKTIKYVHELQNLLRVVGLEELANNFRIQ